MQSHETPCIFADFRGSVISGTADVDHSRIPVEVADVGSNFGDSKCGEPLYAQHLSLDFTPNEEIDTDFVQKKCCTFWTFIQNTPEIQNLIAKPEKNFIPTVTSNTPCNTAETSKTESVCSKSLILDAGNSTAVSMLEFVEGKGLIDRTFEAKMPQSKCTLGSREYKESESFPRLEKNVKKKLVCPCTVCVRPSTSKKINPCSPVYLSPKEMLSRKMNEWDAKHPKTMDPPGHAPSLQHAVLQRLVKQ